MIGRDTEGLGKFIADGEGTLRSSPDREPSIAPLGHCGAWLQGSVSDVGNRIGLLQLLFGRSHSGFDGTCLTAAPATAFAFRIFSQIVEQLRFGRLSRGRPLGLEHFQRVVRNLGISSDDACKISIVYYLNVGKLFRSIGIERSQSRIEGAGTQQLAVQHSQAGNVRGVLMLAGHEGFAVHFGNVGSGNMPVGCRSGSYVAANELDNLFSFG